MRQFPSDRIATGWYQIGWSSDFTVGSVVPLHYFDTELVAYRGESGEVNVFDAYCPHMGAHLGHGGCVEGDAIRCPYHGWKFSADGPNIEIPYSSPDAMGRLRLRKWHTREIDQIVHAYYSPDRSASPAYDLPDQWVRFEGETWEACPETTKLWSDQQMSPQFMSENVADAAHFKYVHGAGNVAEVESYGPEGCVYKAEIKLRFGADDARTWATPNGPVDGRIFTENWGIGTGWARLQAFDDVIYLLGITPITARTAELRSTTWVARKRSDGSELSEKIRNLWVAQQNSQVDSDLKIWNTMSYVHQPPLAKSEVEPMRVLRSWFQQFYETSAPAE